MYKGSDVQKMFDSIAGRYDLMNLIMTLGLAQKWRKFVVSTAGDPGDGLIFDLATGTGDIAALMLDSYPQARVVAGDFSLNMLEEARKRFADKKIYWQACDAGALPFRTDSFNSVTFGYLLRNVDDVTGVLQEVFRVLKRGGRVVCLDTTPPSRNILYPFILFYFRYVVPFLGRLIANNTMAYSYLTRSTMDFYSIKELARLFSDAGFVNVGYKRYMFGTIGVHWGGKP